MMEARDEEKQDEALQSLMKALEKAIKAEEEYNEAIVELRKAVQRMEEEQKIKYTLFTPKEGKQEYNEASFGKEIAYRKVGNQNGNR